MSEEIVKPSQARPNKKHTADVLAGFKRDGNTWRTSTEIAAYIPAASKQTRYTLVSALKYYEILDRRDAMPGESGEYRYRLSAQALLDKPAETISAEKQKTKPPKPSGRFGKYVHWKDEERTLIASTVRAVRNEKATSLINAVEKAQRILVAGGKLEPHRTRKLTLAQANWIYDHPAYKTNVPGVTAAPPVPPQAAPAPPAPEPTPAPPKVAAPLTTGALIDTLLVRMQQGVKSILTDAIDYGLTRAFKNIVDSQQGQALLKGLRSGPVADATPKHDPVHHSAERERLTRILVAGVRPGEVGELNNEFSKVFDLRYWFEGDSSHLLKDRCKNVDSAVILIKRLGHSDADLVKNSGVPYKFAVGNNPALAAKETLTDMYIKN